MFPARLHRALPFTVLLLLGLAFTAPSLACDTPCCGDRQWTYVNWSSTGYSIIQSNLYPAGNLASERCASAWNNVSSLVTAPNGWFVEMRKSPGAPYVWQYRCNACIIGLAPYWVGDLVTRAPIGVKAAIDNVIGTTGGVVVDSELVMNIVGDDCSGSASSPHYRIGVVVEDSRIEALVDAMTGEVTLPGE